MSCSAMNKGAGRGGKQGEEVFGKLFKGDRTEREGERMSLVNASHY